MDKFWEWMFDKKYAVSCYYTQYHEDKVEGIFIPKTYGLEFTHQMLIGYMIEYLSNYKHIDIKIPIGQSNYFDNIEELYINLTKKIKLL